MVGRSGDQTTLGLVSAGRFTGFVPGKNPPYEVGKNIELFNIFPNTKYLREEEEVKAESEISDYLKPGYTLDFC